MTALFERLAARVGAAVPLAVPGLQLVPKGAIALAEHVNRYYRVFTGADPQNVAVRLPPGGGSFEVRHSATNAALLRVTDAGLDFPAGGIGTVELADGSVTSAKILDNEIVNADVNAAAAIGLAKLAHVGANNVLRSNGTANVGGQVATADIADGAVTSLKILDGTILNVDVNAAAAIAYGKLALTNSIVNADIAPAGTAQIAVNKLLHVGAGNVLRSDGAQNVAGQVVTGDIANGTILDADINAAAAINGSKLLDNSVSSAKLSGGLSVPANSITTAEIANGTILDADINAAAAIAASKLYGGGTANRVLRTTDGTSSVWGQVGTLDIAAGATLGFWSANGVPANYAGTPQSGIIGSAITITMAAANPLLLGVSLMSAYNLTAPATLTIQIWEGAAAITTVGAISINTTDLRGIAKTYSTTATAGAHTYFLTWAVTAGTVTAADFSFWAMEIRR